MTEKHGVSNTKKIKSKQKKKKNMTKQKCKTLFFDKFTTPADKSFFGLNDIM